MAKLPWAQERGLDAVLERWQEDGGLKACFAAHARLEAASPAFEPFPEALHPALCRALAQHGVKALYSHQREALLAAWAGRHVVVATPTASGKSFCFHLPVLQALLQEQGTSAIYLYPTKALSRDQEHQLRALMADAGLSSEAAVFDGDTPGDARRKIRELARIILTNPDMLHSGILPNHHRWAATFRGLRYVVLDELHTYRGVFGSHMAHVVARLRRIARFHGSDPQFIVATATIGNPHEHACRLLGLPPETVTLVERSGAPRAAREFFLYNPPLVNAELGIRGSSLHHTVRLAADLVRARVPTLVFGPSRNAVETMLKYLRQSCHGQLPPEAIMAYRGGYLPEKRRAIEQGLREGEILCVVATNALELGIDIGDLDAVLCAGYPGSVAALWQRFGRAGRRGARSVAVLVCNNSPLDQYLAQAPASLHQAGAEEARIDPSNVEVLIQHLKCAAFEIPFELEPSGSRPAQPREAYGESYAGLSPNETREALQYLGQHGLVHHSAGRFHYTGEPFPASSVSLRNIGWDNFVIIDVASSQAIAELDWHAAHTMLHEQAIYQHDAEQYQVERLDYENHKAYVRKVEPDYFTTALTYRTVSVIEELKSAALGPARIGLGDVKVLQRVTGYKKVKFFTHENAGYGDVQLPEIQMHTVSFWLTLPEALVRKLGKERAHVVEGLRGLGTALETVATVALMCDPKDINRTLGDGGSAEAAQAKGRNPQAGQTGQHDPTVFLFDAHPGGVGLSPRIHERIAELLQRTAGLIECCPCAAGCPACVGPSTSELPIKALALRILRALGPEANASAGHIAACSIQA